MDKEYCVLLYIHICRCNRSHLVNILHLIGKKKTQLLTYHTFRDPEGYKLFKNRPRKKLSIN